MELLRKCLIVLIMLFCVVAFLGCGTAQKEKDFVVANDKALEVLIPKYLAYIELSPPSKDSLAFLNNYTFSTEESAKVKALLEYLGKVPIYDEKEKAAIADSYNQFLKTSKTAAEEAKE